MKLTPNLLLILVSVLMMSVNCSDDVEQKTEDEPVEKPAEKV